MGCEDEPTPHWKTGVLSEPSRLHLSLRDFTITEFAIARIVHVAQMIAAVVVSIDIERIVMFTGVVDSHDGIMQTSRELLVFPIVVRTVTTDAIDGIFA